MLHKFHTHCLTQIRYPLINFIVPAGKFILAVVAPAVRGWKQQQTAAQDGNSTQLSSQTIKNTSHTLSLSGQDTSGVHLCYLSLSSMIDESEAAVLRTCVFSAVSVKGYTSALCSACCGNFRNRTRARDGDRWVFLAGYPVLSRAAGPTLTSSPLLTSDPLIV